MKWAINWMSTILVIYILVIFVFSYAYAVGYGFFGLFIVVVFGTGPASLGYGGALFLERLLMKGAKLSNAVFIGTSLLISIGLCVLVASSIVFRSY